jgi:hypothetical protein
VRRTAYTSFLACIISSLALVTPSLAAGKPPATSKAPVVTVPKGAPQIVIVQRIGIKAPVEITALSKPADVHAPFKWGDVAWYSRGARPGELGRAAFFGHLDSTCCPAIFYHLKDVRPGDVVQVAYKSGPALKFKVQWIASYPNNKLPVKFLFNPVHERGISLITCGGDFRPNGVGYDHKIVVYARLILANGKLG